MTRRERVLSSPEYWYQDAQLDLYAQVSAYIKKEDINKTELAKRLNVSKGYISQILNGNFNYTLKKLIELSLAIGLVPKITYTSVNEIIEEDAKLKVSYNTNVTEVIEKVVHLSPDPSLKEKQDCTGHTNSECQKSGTIDTPDKPVPKVKRPKRQLNHI